MKRRIVSLTVLFFWLVSGFRFSDHHLSGPMTSPDEVPFYVQPNGQSLALDRDYDGLTDGVETNGWWDAAGFFTTDPLDSDSDNDGLTDGEEKLFDTNPLDDTSPGIYIEYDHDFKTSKYFPWEKHGSKFIALDSAVVRRGATFYVGGPADATIDTTLDWQQWDPCAGRWKITVSTGEAVGKYTITLQKGAWSKSLNLYVIFELPTSMSSDADVAAYVYSDDPGNFRDEYAIWYMTTNDLDYSWDLWPPYHMTIGYGRAFQTDHYQAYVFEDYIIDAINGYTSQRSAVTALGHRLDETLRFHGTSLEHNMWETLHGSSWAQCSTHASAMTSFARGAGIPARPVISDWDMFVMGDMLFDHSTEVWLSGGWEVMRAYKYNESPPPTPIARGIYPPRSRGSWFYRDSGGDIVVVADSNWVWEQMQTGWEGSNQLDYLFGNYNNREIVRWDWVDTEVTRYNGWGWGSEPADIGDPYETWLYWPSVPTPSIIVNIEGSGSVTKDPDLSYYQYDDVVTLEAFPEPGWSFSDWSGDPWPEPSTDNPETVTITDEDDVVVTANFTQDEYTLTVNIDGGGSVSKDPDQATYYYGDVVTLRPIPGPHFDYWSGPNAGELQDNGDGTWDLTMDGDKSVTAHFAPIPTSTPTNTPTPTSTPTESGSESNFLNAGNSAGFASAPTSTPTPTATATPTSASFPDNTVGVPPSQSAETIPPSSGVQLGQVVADYGVDLDGNGRFDQLVIEVEVHATQPGYYSIGGLLDSDQFTSYTRIPALASAATYTYLEAGSQTVQLAFDGLSISLARVDGPYEVKGLWISNLDLDADPIDLALNTLHRKDPAYSTAAYRASHFETLGATIMDQYSERGVDSDHDGRYESLTIDVGWAFQTPGMYTMMGDLYDRQDQFISQAIWSGSHSPASLQFDEIQGTAGPYTLRSLYLLNANEEIVDSRVQAYTTQQVMKAEGKTRIVDQADSGQIGAKAILDTYSDSGQDLDDDGLYDLLVIEAQVEVAEGEADLYRLEGWLEGGDGSLISWASSDPISLTVGTHSLSLPFSGPAIHTHNTDGPFTLIALKLLRGEGYEVDDEVDIAYTTSAYTHDQFEEALASGAVGVFEDNMENGSSRWTVEPPWSLTNSVWHSYSHAWEADASGSQNGSLTTLSLDLSNRADPVLKFSTCYDMQSSGDVGYLEVSTNEGLDWTRVATYTSATSRWSTELLDLSSFIAPNLQVRFEAESQDGLLWYVDDVCLTVRPDDDGDGLSNVDEDDLGTDPDDPDSDDDGLSDGAEVHIHDTDPLDDDSDDDGLPDGQEVNDHGTDPDDPDSDDDGMSDGCEVDNGFDPLNDSGDADDDPDADGLTNEEECNAGTDPYNPDTDDDGIPDGEDPYPIGNDPTLYFPLIFKR